MSTQLQAIQEFVQQSNKIFAEGKVRAGGLPPQTVQVWPGGATFTTIQAAINSITNASPQVQYQVAVGPGTYNENVTMKDYVYVIGTEQDKTFITAPAQGNFANGVVNSASGGGISDLTITATSGSWGACPIGIKVCGTGKFHISGVTIISGDVSNTGNNVRGITNNTGAYGGTVLVSQCIFIVSGGSDSTCVGLDWMEWSPSQNGYMQVDLTAIQVTSNAQTFGVSTAVGATATLNQSKIIAGTWALYDSDGHSIITANQCTIAGPVSGGVVVNN